MPDGSRADPARAFSTIALTSSRVKSAVLKGMCGIDLGGWNRHSLNGIFVDGSLCVVFKW